jgi:hypothetical protein
MNTTRIIFPLVALVASCSSATDKYSTATGSISGRVIKGAVASPSITVTAAMSGETVATATGAEDGTFTVDMGSAGGDFVVCAAEGSYIEEATGTLVELSGQKLCTAVVGFSEAGSASVLITPWTHLAVARATSLVRYLGVQPFADAWARGAADVNAFVGCGSPEVPDFLAIDPEDPTVPREGGTDLTPGLVSGLLLAGLSQQAKMASEALGITPGVKLTAIRLVQALYVDIDTDCALDGFQSRYTRLDAEGYLLGPDTLRGAPNGFVQGIRRFLESDRNATGATVADLGDLLACLATNGSPIFRTAPGGGELDTQGPTIIFLAPQDGATVNGIMSLHVRAEDPSGMRDLSATQGQEVMTALATTLSDKAAELTATIDTTPLPAGPVALNFTAADVHGNTSEATLSVVINNNAPVITVLSPADGATVAGVVTISATATATDTLTTFSLVAPAGVTDTDAAINAISALWDTAQAPEGLVAIHFAASDATGNTVDKSIAVTVDNLKPGELSGVASLDSPIQNGKLEVLDYRTGARGALLASGDVSDGVFSVKMPDQFDGTVLLRMFGPGASYRDAATTQAVVFSTRDELTTLVDYAASPTGTVIGGLSVNALTTLATTLTDRLQEQSMSLGEARNLAFELFAVHMQRPDPFDIRMTQGSNFSMDPGQDPDANLRVGMWHVGLSRMGAELATSAGMNRTAFGTLDILPLLARDLEDTVLNGKDGGEAVVNLLPGQPLVTNTLRSHHAKAILRWLQNVPLGDGFPGTNTTTVDPGMLGAPGAFLDMIASDRSRLFGPEPLESYDLVGPTITVITPAGNPAYLEGVVTVDATASDPSGIASFSIDNVPPAALGVDQDASPDHLLITLDVAKLYGTQTTLDFVAEDSKQNSTTLHRAVVLDNQPPQVQIDFPAVVAPGAPLAVTATDPTGIPVAPQAGALSVRSVNIMCSFGADQDPSVGRFAGVLNAPTIYSCDGPQTLRVNVSDLRGNSTQVDRPYTIDRTPPTLAVSFPTGVHQTTFTLAGTVSDVGSSVASVSIYVNSNPAVVIQNPSASWSQLLTVPCEAFSTIRVVATDQAGLTVEQQAGIVCDQANPSLTLLGSNYVDETTVTVNWEAASHSLVYLVEATSTLVDLGSADWTNSGIPLLLKKFYNRLDYLPAASFDEATNNLPYLRFLGADASSPVGTQPDDLVADYDYWVDGTLQRDWTPLTVAADGSFKLPFSYQTLGPMLADASGTKRQLIHVKLTDRGGNAVTMLFYFRLQAMLPPVVYTGCNVGDLQGKTLAAKNLHQWFQSISNPTAFSGRLYFPALPAGSGAPWTFDVGLPDVTVHASEALRAWRVEYTNGMNYLVFMDYTDPRHPTDGSCRPSCSAPSQAAIWQADNPAGTCRSGMAQDHGIASSSGWGSADYNLFAEADLATFNSTTGRWAVPLDRQVQGQYVSARERAQGPRPFPIADYAPNPTNYAWPIQQLNGQNYYFVRSHTGMDFKYYCETIGRWDYRPITLREYVADMSFNVGAVQPQVYVTGNPTPLTLLVPSGETCGQVLSHDTSEP